jgi:hypothetical protein
VQTTPAEQLDDQQIAALVTAMKRLTVAPQYIDAGYTYLGQFIAHDIVPETHPRRGPARKVRPCLNLDSLYGTRTSGFLDAQGMFAPGEYDLPRNPQGTALIPDRRNDENVILAQLHLFLQRFHNFTINSGCASNAAEARRLVTRVFQLIVVEDYLRQVLAPDVFCSYFHTGQRWLNLSASRIPKIFSHAAFRFGHSMVRDSYKSFPRITPDVPLLELFRPGSHLDRSLVVNWADFFGWPGPGGGAQHGLAIDPFITPPMAEVIVPSRNGTHTLNLIDLNLKSGREAGLPSGWTLARRIRDGDKGQAIARAFQLHPLRDLGVLSRIGGLSDKDRITFQNLPLWPYILLEAVKASGGRHLGPLGSLICAEVIANAISLSQDSIYPDGLPVSVDTVLTTLGPLGKRIRSVQRANVDNVTGTRSLSMRHIIELVETF